MKRIILLAVLLSMTAILAAVSQNAVAKTITRNNVLPETPDRLSRLVLQWEVHYPPVDIMETYFDFMPGSFYGSQVEVQPEGYTAGGVYITFHARETMNGNLYQYFAYIDDQGQLDGGPFQLFTNPVSEWDGYGSCAIDPLTADPYFAWQKWMPEPSPQVYVAMDAFSLLGGPGLWTEPEMVITPQEIDWKTSYPRPDNVYQMPEIHIGPSPLGEGFHRLYIVARNTTDHGEGIASGNPILYWTDYDPEVFDGTTFDNWSWTAVHQMNAWDTAGEGFSRAHCAFVTGNDGQVAFIGYDDTKHRIFCYVNDDYGEGLWEEHIQDYRFFVDNPADANGNPTFTHEDGSPIDSLMFTFTNSGHFNAAPDALFSKIFFPGHLALRRDNPDGSYTWWTDLVFPKVFHFDVDSRSFGMFDLYPKEEYPWDDQPILPWDLNEDGAVDVYDANGSVVIVREYPIYDFNPEQAPQGNLWKIVANDDNGWMAVVWQSSIKARLAAEGVDGYLNFLNKPEICISISNDMGYSWFDPIVMNNVPGDIHYMPELDGMIPAYVYPGDTIEPLDQDNTHGLLHLFFLDDDSYPDSGIAQRPRIPGTLKYMAIDITFSYPIREPDRNSPAHSIAVGNYPNPFNPETTIQFDLPQETPVRLKIYNVQGQLVKTLVDEEMEGGNHSITWNGTDKTGNPVSSGFYFARLAAGKQLETRRMLLLK